MASGHDGGRDARAPRVASPLQKMSKLLTPSVRPCKEEEHYFQRSLKPCGAIQFSWLTMKRAFGNR